jgi:hypothetical protein
VEEGREDKEGGKKRERGGGGPRRERDGENCYITSKFT